LGVRKTNRALAGKKRLTRRHEDAEEERQERGNRSEERERMREPGFSFSPKNLSVFASSREKKQ
jgi:hypothetical protein